MENYDKLKEYYNHFIDYDTTMFNISRDYYCIDNVKVLQNIIRFLLETSSKEIKKYKDKALHKKQLKDLKMIINLNKDMFKENYDKELISIINKMI